MTPQELKNSILQLAIQGKLVEQRPEEGTAEELFAQIQKEKQRLIAEKKIKKEKPLPEITEDEKPFDIPENWKWVRFGAVISLVSGTDFKPEEYNDQGRGTVYITGASNLSENGVIISRWTETPRNFAYRGDILLVCKGSGYGKTVICDVDEAHIARQIMAIKHKNTLNMNFIRYYLQANITYLKAKGQGVIPGIDRASVLNAVFPLPPLAEQQRIVAKIEELLPYIDRYEQAWSKLEQFNSRFPEDMKKSLLQYAIQGKLVEQRPEEGTAEELFAQIQAEKQRLIAEKKIKKEMPLPEITEDEKPFDIPESWKWVRLLSVIDIATNLVQPSEYAEYMHIAPDNIEKGTGRLLECRTVKEDKVASVNHLFKKGQIIYSKIRPLLRKAIIAPFDGLCSADMYPLNTTLNKKYVLYYLLSDGYNVQIANAMSSRVKMPKINQNELTKVLLPLPPLAEQKRIVEKLEQLLPLCERLK